MPDGLNLPDLAALQGDIAGLAEQITAFSDRTGNELGGLGARLDEVEQKIARPGSAGSYNSAGAGGGSLGRLVASSDELQRLMALPGRRGRAQIAIPSQMLAAITTISTSAGSMLSVDRRVGSEADIILAPRRRLTVRALLGRGTTTSSAVEFAREDVYTNNAGMVSEGGQKPESDLTFEPMQSQVRKIAHFIIVSQEALADAPALSAVIDSSLRYGLSLAEETQLLYGSGVGIDLFGIIPQATAYNPAFTPAMPTDLDDLSLAILQVEEALFPADGIVLNPRDWFRILLTKDSQGRYLLGTGPGTAAPPQIWGLPVAVTPAITQGSFLVGSFQLGATIFDREEANVQVSTETGDMFTTNRATVLAEERLALVVRRPAAFVTGAFSLTT
jgi:HK97 family phage major capsid protein